MHRWLIDQDSSVSSEMPDGQGVWHYDDEVNICNTYTWLSLLLLYLYVYIYIYLLCIFHHFCTCHLKCVTIVALLLLLFCFCFFLSLSLLFLSCVAYGTVVLVPLTLLVSLLCCELIQSGVVGSGWSFFFLFFFYFVPVLA